METCRQAISPSFYLDRRRAGETADAVRRSRSTCRSQLSNWFQLTKMRLTTFSPKNQRSGGSAKRPRHGRVQRMRNGGGFIEASTPLRDVESGSQWE